MWSTEKLQVRDRESDNSWFSQLFVSLSANRDMALPGRTRIWHPPTDVYETDTHVMVKIEVAGVTKSDFMVRLRGRSLSVAGHRGDPETKLAYQQMEISYGAFLSEVNLPCDVDEDDVRANYENGFLHVMLPKLQQEHRVPVVVVIEHQA